MFPAHVTILDSCFSCWAVAGKVLDTKIWLELYWDRDKVVSTMVASSIPSHVLTLHTHLSFLAKLAGTRLIAWLFLVPDVYKKCSVLKGILFKFSWAQFALQLFFELVVLVMSFIFDWWWVWFGFEVFLWFCFCNQAKLFIVNERHRRLGQWPWGDTEEKASF